MNNLQKFNEDEQIIGTPRYPYFQQMCNEAGLFAIKDAQDKGLPLTYAENDEVIKEFADGKKEILGKIAPQVRVTQKVYKLT